MALQEIICKDATIAQKLVHGPPGSNTQRAFMMGCQLYSDKTTIGNNLNAYPVHMICVNGSLSHSQVRARAGTGGLIGCMATTVGRPG